MVIPNVIITTIIIPSQMLVYSLFQSLRFATTSDQPVCFLKYILVIGESR